MHGPWTWRRIAKVQRKMVGVGARISSMPRRSAADISIVTLAPGKGRPEAPRALDPTEARAWNDVVDSLPGHWLDPAGQILLEQTAVQIAVSNALAMRLRRMREAGDNSEEALEVEAKLATQHQSAVRSIAFGLTTLRATPRSR